MPAHCSAVVSSYVAFSTHTITWSRAATCSRAFMGVYFSCVLRCRALALAEHPTDLCGEERRAFAADVALCREPAGNGAKGAPLGREGTRAGHDHLLCLDGDQHAAVRVEAVAVGHAAARLLPPGAD